jgi:hypothetical protein
MLPQCSMGRCGLWTGGRPGARSGKMNESPSAGEFLFQANLGWNNRNSPQFVRGLSGEFAPISGRMGGLGFLPWRGRDGPSPERPSSGWWSPALPCRAAEERPGTEGNPRSVARRRRAGALFARGHDRIDGIGADLGDEAENRFDDDADQVQHLWLHAPGREDRDGRRAGRWPARAVGAHPHPCPSPQGGGVEQAATGHETAAGDRPQAQLGASISSECLPYVPADVNRFRRPFSN